MKQVTQRSAAVQLPHGFVFPFLPHVRPRLASDASTSPSIAHADRQEHAGMRKHVLRCDVVMRQKMRICPRRVMATSPDHASETVVPMGRNHVVSGSFPALGRFETKSVRKHRTRFDHMGHEAARNRGVRTTFSSSAVPVVPKQRGWVRSTVCVSFSFGFDWKRLRDSFGFEREVNRDPWRRLGRDVGEKVRNG